MGRGRHGPGTRPNNTLEKDQVNHATRELNHQFRGICPCNCGAREVDEALRWLRRAVDAGDLGVDNPAWNSLRSKPQFQQMKAEVDARVAEMRRRVDALEAEWKSK